METHPNPSQVIAQAVGIDRGTAVHFQFVRILCKHLVGDCKHLFNELVPKPVNIESGDTKIDVLDQFRIFTAILLLGNWSDMKMKL